MKTPRLGRIGVAAIGLMAVCAATAAPASAQGLFPVNFFPKDRLQAWSVPTGVQSVAVTITGGAGGPGTNNAFTYASTTTATLTIPPGVSALDVAVGGNGQSSQPSGGSATPGGWPNGGSSASNGYWTGGGGGGSTDIRPSGAPFTSALIITGGAGGSGGYAVPSYGGVGGFGAAGGAGFGQPGEGSDGGAGGAPGAQPTGSTGQGGDGAPGPNANSGSGGGGGGGWRGGAAGSPGTAWAVSFRNGAGGGGGGGIGSAVPQYVTGISSYAASAPSGAQIQYLDVLAPSVPALTVGTFATWTYIAGVGATYAVTSGALPPGLTLDGNSGTVQGVPTQAGTFTVTVTSSVYPDGTNAVSTGTTTTVTVNAGGPADLVATGATGIGTTYATLNGAVTPGGAPVTNITCAYSTTNPGSRAITASRRPATPATVNPSPTPAATPVVCPVTGLVGNRTYYFQVQGTQQGSAVRSRTAQFVTGSAPAQPTTTAASGITPTTATGRGSLTATQKVSAIFCRAATTISGVASNTGSPRPITATASPPSTRGVVVDRPVTCALAGLRPNTFYYYAVFARDSTGTAMSPSMWGFSTLASPPRVGTISARAVTSTTAVINGSVIPTNESVTGIQCRYSTSPGNPVKGTSVAATPARISAKPVRRDATCNLAGLAPSTTYQVRMEATDAAGTGASGNIVRFTTAASGSASGASGATGSSVAPTVSITQARAVAGQRIDLRVRVNQPGTIRVVGTYPLGAKAARSRATATACTATRTAKSAGTVAVSCALTPATRSRLRTGPLAIALRATFTTAAAQSATAARALRVPRFPPRTAPVTG